MLRIQQRATRVLALSLLYLFLLSLISGCASIAGQPAPAAIATIKKLPDISAEPGGVRWFSARFKVHWPEATAPNWSIDGLIADRIARPALHQHASEIQLWRFHRRARRDQLGRSFTLMIYTDPHTAASVYAMINSNPLTRQLMADGALDRVTYSQPTEAKMGLVESTSDSAWSPVVQRVWPAFIMGVSQSWMELVYHAARDFPVQERPSTEQLLAQYDQAGRIVTQIWRLHGQHAYLHHLSAVFGYQPLAIKF